MVQHSFRRRKVSIVQNEKTTAGCYGVLLRISSRGTRHCGPGWLLRAAYSLSLYVRVKKKFWTNFFEVRVELDRADSCERAARAIAKSRVARRILHF
jgi:hypothetical protein